MNYLPADNSFIINCGNPDGSESDNSLKPIRISLPKSPKLELIDGYGLLPEEQYWRRPEMPSKLVQLEREVKYELEEEFKDNKNNRITGYKILDGIWSKLEANIDYYREEIAWIKRQWYFRLKGYWFFNNGKPTYICGWHYFYLSWWKIEGRLYPQFRDRDRKNFLFWWYSFTTKETFKQVDKDGKAIPNQSGEYEMEERNTKVCMGVAQPKNRRGGTTNMSQAAQFENTSKVVGGLAVVFSMTETSASSLFTGKTVKSWGEMPFFYVPMFSGYYDEKTSIEFKRPKNLIIGNQLNSKITYAKSAFGAEFDGEYITFAIFDESGKTSECQIDERWSVHKQGLSLGDGSEIVGFSLHPSTVEDMEESGGIHYQSLIYDSDFYQRNEVTGQTKSGLFRLLFPGYEGLEGFIGKYGESIINDPTEQQIKDGFKFKYGSKKHVQSNRDMLLNSKDPKNQIKYRRLVVKYPFTLDECFKLTIGSTAWNMEVIDSRLAELRRMKEPFVRGNFVWEGGVKFSKVIFVPRADGKFELSWLLADGESNQKTTITLVDPVTGDYKECFAPLNPKRGIVGADAFKFKGDKSMALNTGSYQSDGGLAALRLRDFRIDPEGKSLYECETPTFVAAYRNRPLSDEYNEDCIMLAQYLGFMIYPETNAGTLWEFCLKHKYDGYLLFDIDPATGRQKDRPGVFQLEKSKEQMWQWFQNYIEFRGHKERHASILKEISQLKTFPDLNKLDLAAASGCAGLGSQGIGIQMMESVDDINDQYDWWLKI